MTKKIMLVLVAGILCGVFLIPGSFYDTTGTLLDIGLCSLLFFVGIDIGTNIQALKNIKKLGMKILLVPVATIIGSLAGGAICGMIMNIGFTESLAVSAGFGWYSLAPVIIAPYSSELSAIAFLMNVFREVLAIICIPFIAKHIGFLETIAIGGATSMDTCLPIITQNTDQEVAIISFVSGVVVSLMVPVLVPLFIGL